MAVYTFPPAVKLTVSSPSIKVAYLYGEPRDLKAGSPVFSRAVMHERFPFFDGQVEIETGWQESDPEVWALNRLKVDDDGLVKEALHANYNDGLLLECDPGLIGRTDIGRGVAHKIDVLAPLTFTNSSIGLDPAFQPGGGGGAVLPAIGFRASKSVDQTGIVSGTYTKVTFAAEDYDRGGYYDPALSRWIPPAGLIHIDVRGWLSGMTAGNSYGFHIYKNGAVLKYQWLTSALSTDGAIANVDDVANGTDYYEVFVYFVGGAGTIQGAAGYTYFSGHAISAQGPQGPAGITGGVPEAPSDNSTYGRRNTAWAPVLLVTGDILDGGNF